jgi:hypothetical protein
VEKKGGRKKGKANEREGRRKGRRKRKRRRKKGASGRKKLKLWPTQWPFKHMERQVDKGKERNGAA